MSLPLSGLDLNALVLFHAVAESGGFTAAADRLGIAKAKVSIQINRLERTLGVALFTRTTRQVALTEAGHRLHMRSAPLIRGLQEAIDHVGDNQGELSGTLRLSTTVDHAVHLLAPAVAAFAQAHPALKIDLRSGDRVQDLVGEGIDVSIRVGWLRDSSMHAVKLGEFRQCVVAAPAYLQGAGPLSHPRDLVQHHWITLSLLPAPLTWEFQDAKGRALTVHLKSRLKVDSPSALRAMLRQGYGVSILDALSAQEDLRTGTLQQVLTDWSLPRGGVYAVYPPGRLLSARTRKFIDFYRDFLARHFPA